MNKQFKRYITKLQKIIENNSVNKDKKSYIKKNMAIQKCFAFYPSNASIAEWEGFWKGLLRRCKLAKWNISEENIDLLKKLVLKTISAIKKGRLNFDGSETFGEAVESWGSIGRGSL